MWIVRDCAGLSCCLFYYLLIAINLINIHLLFFNDRLSDPGFSVISITIFYYLLSSLMLVSHIFCVLLDPGTIPEGYKFLDYERLPHQFHQGISSAGSSYASDSSHLSSIPPQNEEEKYDMNGEDPFLATYINTIRNLEHSSDERHRKLVPLLPITEGQIADNRHRNGANNRSHAESEGKIPKKGSFRKRINILYEMINNRCKKCMGVKPPQTHHCSKCNRCIARMDHHCPWVNNCVGYNNQKSYLLFLMYTVIYGFISLIILSYESIRMAFTPEHPYSEMQFFSLLLIYSFLLCLIMMLFPFGKLLEQITMLVQSTSYIDRLQGRNMKRRGLYEALVDATGCEFSCMWFLPSRNQRPLIIEYLYQQFALLHNIGKSSEKLHHISINYSQELFLVFRLFFSIIWKQLLNSLSITLKIQSNSQLKLINECPISQVSAIQFDIPLNIPKYV